MTDSERFVSDMDTEDLSVFIAHSSEDIQLMSIINEGLKSRNVKTFTYEDDISGGQEVAGAISEGIQQCSHFLLIVTNNSLDSSWCRLELILALEKAQTTNKLSAMFLIKDMESLDKTKLPDMSLLQDITQMALEFEDCQGNTIWKQSQIEEVIDKLKDVKSISSVLPAGNVAHGQVWSHFCGFLEIVLPRLQQKVQEYKDLKMAELGDDIRMPLKVYELIPESCVIHPKIPDVEESGKLPTIEVIRGGNPRRYALTVYRIRDDDGKYYYCVAEYPSTLGVLNEMQKPEYKHLTMLSKADRRLQVSRYYYTMTAILKHPAMNCQNRARLLLYNEKNTTPRDVLLQAIKEDLENQMGDLEEDGETALKTKQRPLTIDRLESVEPEKKDHDAYIAFYDDDSGTAAGISEHLQAQHLNVILPSAGGSLLDRRVDIEKSRWLILILSKAAMKDELFFARLNQILSGCVNEKRVRMIPVLVDIEDTEIPDVLKWVVYIDTRQQSESQYLSRLCQAVKGCDIPMFLESHIPAGNVAHGLAWAYYVNLLKVILPDCPRQIPSFLEKRGLTGRNYCEKFIILVPSSCDGTGKIDQKNDFITSPFKETLTVTREHGGSKRDYNFPLMGLQDGDEVHYFTGLYAAPVVTLQQMQEFRIAGIQESTMKREASSFCNILQAILSRDTEISQYVQIIEFDDSNRGNLSRRLVQEIRNDLLDADHSESDMSGGLRTNVWLIGAVIIGTVSFVYRIYRRLN